MGSCLMCRAPRPERPASKVISRLCVSCFVPMSPRGCCAAKGARNLHQCWNPRFRSCQACRLLPSRCHRDRYLWTFCIKKGRVGGFLFDFLEGALKTALLGLYSCQIRAAWHTYGDRFIVSKCGQADNDI